MGLLDQPQNGGLFSQLGNSQGSWGPLLMALGAGIAGKADQGWGAGIGSGLGLATTVGQNQRNEAIKQQQLQATLQHQQIMENLGLLNAQSGQMNAASQAQNAQTSASVRTDAEARRQQEDVRREQALAGPVGLINSSAPQYATAKTSILSNMILGKDADTIKNIIIGAAKIQGQKPDELYDTMLPTSTDKFETRAAKLQRLEAYLSDVRGGIETGSPTLAPRLWATDAFGPQSQEPTPRPVTTVPIQPQPPVRAGVGGEPPTQSLAGERVPAGVDPNLWAVMTPQEKALWPK